MTSFLVRRLAAADWALYREVRLAALACDPTAFGSNLAREQGFAEADWRRRAARASVALSNGAPVGVVGWFWSEEPHRADLVAMWVDPRWRGRGVGAALVDDVVDQVVLARSAVLELGVVEANTAARARYARSGFVETGHETGAFTGDAVVRMRYQPGP